MISEDLIVKAIQPLPAALRIRILLELRRRINEGIAAGREEDWIERDIVQTILQEIYWDTIYPIEMIERMLDLESIRAIGGFEVEFSESVFDMSLIEKTSELRSDFWSLVQELGLSGKVRAREKRLNWKSQEGRKR